MRLAPLATALFLPALAVAGPVTGEDALALIRNAMLAAGHAPPAMTAPLRDLPDCDHPPRVAPFAGNWAAAELTCDAPGWTRVLRTGAPAAPLPPRVERPVPKPSARMLATATRALPRGARLGPQDLTQQPFTAADPAQAIADPAVAVGRRLRVALGPGQPLLERHLEPISDVEPGQSVTVLLDASGIGITTEATAITGGRNGDRVSLRPPSGADPIEGVIVAPGIVRIRANMPAARAVNR